MYDSLEAILYDIYMRTTHQMLKMNMLTMSMVDLVELLISYRSFSVLSLSIIDTRIPCRKVSSTAPTHKEEGLLQSPEFPIVKVYILTRALVVYGVRFLRLNSVKILRSARLNRSPIQVALTTRLHHRPSLGVGSRSE